LGKEDRFDAIGTHRRATPARSESRRVVAIVVLGVLLAGQLVFTLMGLLGFGLGGGSALEFGLSSWSLSVGSRYCCGS
jgi:hypothetical protein